MKRFRSAYERTTVRAARKLGWTVEKRNGVGHLVMVHPETKERVSMPSTKPHIDVARRVAARLQKPSS